METEMKRLLGIIFIISALFIGCSFGVVNTKMTLMEPPFAVETLRGNVTEATRCVGAYWRKTVLPAGVWWKMNPESLPLIASGVGLGRWEPPVSLVINFDERDGKTIARAYMHGGFSMKDERRAITLRSLAACRDNAQSYYGGVKAIVLTNGDVIEGEIISIEQDVLKIRTKKGQILSFSFMDDVKQYIYKK